MNPILDLPSCPKCRVHLGPGLFNLGQFAQCPNCQNELWVEVFGALFRAPAPAATSAPVMIQGESTCFYHDAKKATVVCDACGRFLCSLCDCQLGGRHYCPPCLEAGDKKRVIEPLEKSRQLHAHQALILALLPFLITGLAAVVVCIVYWKSPGSLVKPERWQMRVALALGSLQVLAGVLLIIMALNR